MRLLGCWGIVMEAAICPNVIFCLGLRGVVSSVLPVIPSPGMTAMNLVTKPGTRPGGSNQSLKVNLDSLRLSGDIQGQGAGRASIRVAKF